jgi:hypothetical protein
MTHSVLLSPREPGRCSYVADMETGGPCCRRVALYLVTSRVASGDAELCAEHAAHVRACPECGKWLATMETAS